MVKTAYVYVQNICAPCACACRYCLLRSDKQANDGVDYWRGKRIAERIAEWCKERMPEEPPLYYVGYCAEYPELFDTIAFNRKNGHPASRFLQCNGIALREKEETDDFVKHIRDAGIENIDATFYGTEEYHDCFAARNGDFRFMLQLAESAGRYGLKCNLTVPITTENLSMLTQLIHILAQAADIRNLHTFLPDYRGRGNLVESIRLTETDIELLPDTARQALNLRRYRTERDWLSENVLPEYEKRGLIVTLRKDNIDLLEHMTCEEIVAYVEGLDEAYYSAIPSVNKLAALYGDPENKKLYRLRDLFWKWQRRYIAENGLRLYDVTDERFCASIRY